MPAIVIASSRKGAADRPLEVWADVIMALNSVTLYAPQHVHTNFVSRTYVHHIGRRATTRGGVTEEDLQQQGRDWVRRHRPDFWAAVGGEE